MINFSVEDSYYFTLMDIATAVREFGSSTLVQDLRNYFPEEASKLETAFTQKDKKVAALLKNVNSM